MNPKKHVERRGGIRPPFLFVQLVGAAKGSLQDPVLESEDADHRRERRLKNGSWLQTDPEETRLVVRDASPLISSPPDAASAPPNGE